TGLCRICATVLQANRRFAAKRLADERFTGKRAADERFTFKLGIPLEKDEKDTFGKLSSTNMRRHRVHPKWSSWWRTTGCVQVGTIGTNGVGRISKTIVQSGASRTGRRCYGCPRRKA